MVKLRNYVVIQRKIICPDNIKSIKTKFLPVSHRWPVYPGLQLQNELFGICIDGLSMHVAPFKH